DQHLVACVRACLGKAQEAFGQLRQRYSQALMDHLCRWMGGYVGGQVSDSDLDDIHQDTWLQVWRSLPQQFDGENFPGWLRTIAYRRLMDWLSERSRNPATLAEEPSQLPADRKGLNPERIVANRELEQALERFLAEFDRLRQLAQEWGVFGAI